MHRKVRNIAHGSFADWEIKIITFDRFNAQRAAIFDFLLDDSHTAVILSEEKLDRKQPLS